MQPAHKRAADSFVTLRASLDLPIPIGLDIDLEPLLSLKVGIGDGGGGTVTSPPSDGHTTTAVDTTSPGVTSQGSPTPATSITSAQGDGEHSGGGPTPTPINPTNIITSSSIAEDSSSDASFTHSAQTPRQSKQGPITSGDQDGAGLLVVVDTSGIATPTTSRVTRPSDGAVIGSGTPIHLATISSRPSMSFSTATATFPSGYTSSEGPRITDVPPSGTSHKRLSLGEIMGIAIALLILFTGIIIFICRRRRAHRRDQAALGWSTSRASYQYQDESASPRFQDVFRRFTIAVPQRRRPESFNEDAAILSPPPMLEYSRSDRSSRSVASSLPQSLHPHIHNSVHRHSVSVGSTSSAGTAQSLSVDIHESPFKDPSPMSAPPFSSSTSFMLSNPPIQTIHISPSPSPKKLFIPSYRPITADLPPIPPLPSSPPPIPPNNPFQVRNPFEDPPG